jgi:hypothetical protein
MDHLRIGEELPEEPPDGSGIWSVGRSDVREEDPDRCTPCVRECP